MTGPSSCTLPMNFCERKTNFYGLKGKEAVAANLIANVNSRDKNYVKLKES